MAINEKEEKSKIQVVIPLSLQKRWDALQASPRYKDKVKYKMVEDMIASTEISVFGAEHPAYENQIADIEKCWSTIRNFLIRLIEDTDKAKENAQKDVQNTLRVLEKEADRIPELERRENEQLRRAEKLEKLLDEANKRADAAEAKAKEAESRAKELQEQLNVENVNLMNQMKEFFNKYSSSSIENTEVVVKPDIAERPDPVTTSAYVEGGIENS